MATLGQLIEFGRHALSGFDSSKDSVAALTGPITSSALTINVDNVFGGGVGVAEIDMELLRVKAIDPTGYVTVFPFGRGYRGTTAAAHAVGSEFRYNPSWPSGTIAREINAVLDSLFPRVYVVKESSGTVDSDWWVTVPDTAIGVIAVWLLNPITLDWSRANRWSWDPHADAADGRTLKVSESVPLGTSYRLVYAERAGTFDLDGSLDQDFGSVTGLPGRMESLVNAGLAARMAPYIGLARLPSLAAEPRLEGDARADGLPNTRLLDSMFQRMLDTEAIALNREHPIKSHRAVN